MAIDDEIRSLDSKHTWKPDSHPESLPLPTHVVLKVKRNSDGSVERFKARVVAGGNFQVYGENFVETYAPVVSFTAVRIFLYLAVRSNMHRAELDVKTAFLNGFLTEDIWVDSPRGIPSRPSQCYKLVKAVYGLKQAHFACHTKLCNDLNEMGFNELPSASCVFMRRDDNGGDTFVLVYVDDILVLSTSEQGIDFVVNAFRSRYEVRVSNDIEWFLGVKIRWLFNSTKRLYGVELSQPLYIDGILRRFGMTNAKPLNTPMVESFWTAADSEAD